MIEERKKKEVLEAWEREKEVHLKTPLSNLSKKKTLLSNI